MTVSQVAHPPKALLLDIGNVVVRWSPVTLYAKIFQDPQERDRFLSEVCTPAWHAQHDAGVSWDDTIPSLIAQHPYYASQISAWRDRWPEMFSGAIVETEAVIEAVHAKGAPIFGLTNMAAETLEGTMAMSASFTRFQDIIVSGREGASKPDPRIYRIACERAGLEPRDFLFVDDSLANVDAARTLGFYVHHFVDPSALRPAVVCHGLL